ncbi:MAG: glycosyltransferase [Candidatus Omnitrophica bacterium]|nr:glycosyltransferase [Candidatus Omnitrophota bacterium]
MVPVCNEANILRRSISRMRGELRQLGVQFDIVICENGSTDGTLLIAQELQRAHPEVHIERLPTPNYGLALKHAIAVCQHDTVLLTNVDFWDMDFVRSSLGKLNHYDLVIGSKAMPGSRDERPLVRKAITRSFNWVLRRTFGFRGTDTHGVKAFKREPLAPVIEHCVTDHFIFDTELVLRAQRAGLQIIEIPVHVHELRQPTYVSLMKRGPQVVWNLAKLWGTLHAGSP